MTNAAVKFVESHQTGSQTAGMQLRVTRAVQQLRAVLLGKGAHKGAHTGPVPPPHEIRVPSEAA